MSDQFLKLHRRIDNALAVLRTENDGNLRSKALDDMKSALDELDQLLGLKAQMMELAEYQSPAHQSHA
jgi:hypothetical protein